MATNDVEQVRSQVQQARTQLQEQRSLVEQRRQEAEKSEQQLKEQESKLPLPTQRRLRQGLYSGLEGRKRRQVISKVKKEISGKKGEIVLFKDELSSFEKNQLKPFESQIVQKESELREYDESKRAYDIALDVYLGDAPVMALDSSLARKYYRLMVSGDKPKLIDVTSGNITTPQNNIPEVTTTPEVDVSFSPPRDLSRTDKIKDFNSFMTGLTIKPIVNETLNVSQQPVLLKHLPEGVLAWSQQGSDVIKRVNTFQNRGSSFALKSLGLNKKVPSPINLNMSEKTPSNNISTLKINETLRTTGSPVRITKLNSLESRGHTQLKKLPTPTQKPILFSNKKSESPKKKSLDFLGGNKSTGSNKKKRKKFSIWGF